MDFKDLIMAAFGIGLQALFRVPQFDAWYNQTKFDGWRGWIMAGFAAVVTLVLFGISCTPLFQFVPCTQAAAWQLGRDFLILFTTNQLANLTFGTSTAKVARKSK
jgi:hypothetical protein